MYKTYKAIFFDWDGTAVMSRQAPVEETVQAMKPLLQKGIKLIIVSELHTIRLPVEKFISILQKKKMKIFI